MKIVKIGQRKDDSDEYHDLRDVNLDIFKQLYPVFPYVFYRII